MSDELRDRRIVVTGGARGIGASAVRAFTAAGAAVVSLDVTEDAGTHEAQAATDAGPGRAVFVRCDISQRAEVTEALAFADRELGGIDALVNAAGKEKLVAVEDITDEEWDSILEVNLRGTFLTNQLVFPYLRERGGRILNFGSDAGLVPRPGGAHYSASKGAVMAWTRSVAAAWGRYGITVNSIVPAIWTPMAAAARARRSDEERAQFEAELRARIPLGGELGDPDRDLAPVLVFMVGDGSRFITGQIISVNGGGGMVR
jgi:NAD(P)-dependent dehydrogenase (short-subunit alcohol dehydrogenase family)